MKKSILIVLVTVLLLSVFGTCTYAEPGTSARAAVVMDVNTGRVLFAKNPGEKLPMASTTKIMTALVAIESGRLKETVKIPREATLVEGSSIYLKEGEKMTLEELVYGLMLRSGNDAALSIALYLGGDVSGFADMMNKTAEKIGAQNTRFENPHGLHADGHYTTAYDLALITSYALKNPVFKEISAAKRKTIPGPTGENWDRNLVNKNKMLWQFEGGDGVKTGFTKKAGRCLVSSATRNSWQITCVVLNCGPMWNESGALLEYSFNNYKNEKVVEADKVHGSVNIASGKQKLIEVKPSKDFVIPIQENERSDIKIVAQLKNNHRAPIAAGQKAGELEVYLKDKKLGTVDLLYCQNAESSDPIYYLKKILLKL